MKRTFLFLFLFLFFPAMMISSCLYAGKSDILLQNLTCEYAHDPLRIDIPGQSIGMERTRPLVDGHTLAGKVEGKMDFEPLCGRIRQTRLPRFVG
jgi:hypothetical protein